MRVTIRKHFRKKKRGISVVRQHQRLTSTVKNFARAEKIKTPISLNVLHKAEGTSLAHTDSVIDNSTSTPVEHKINLDLPKIQASGENVDKLLRHELGHIKDRHISKLKHPRDSFSKSAKGRKLLKKITKKYPHLKGKGKYERNPEEQFARAYSEKLI